MYVKHVAQEAVSRCSGSCWPRCMPFIGWCTHPRASRNVGCQQHTATPFPGALPWADGRCLPRSLCPIRVPPNCPHCHPRAASSHWLTDGRGCLHLAMLTQEPRPLWGQAGWVPPDPAQLLPLSLLLPSRLLPGAHSWHFTCTTCLAAVRCCCWCAHDHIRL